MYSSSPPAHMSDTTLRSPNITNLCDESSVEIMTTKYRSQNQTDLLSMSHENENIITAIQCMINSDLLTCNQCLIGETHYYIPSYNTE